MAFYSRHKHWLMGGIFALLFAWITVPTPTSANVSTVQATGVSASTAGATNGQLRRDALQDALYQAALKGGAKVSGYSALSGSTLTSDVLLIRPDARILDYVILSETTDKKQSSITIKAVIGSLDEPALCSRKAKLEVAIAAPDVTISRSAPAWLNTLQSELPAVIERSVQSLDGVTIVPAAPRNPQLTTNIAAEYSYTALTRGTPQAISQPNTHRIDTQIAISAPVKSGMSEFINVGMDIRMSDPSLVIPPTKRAEKYQIKLRSKTPWGVVNALSLKTRDEVASNIGEKITKIASDLVHARICKPLAAPLELKDGALTVPYGSNDGLTKLHLAYTQGTSTPYEIFEIAKISKHHAIVRPLNRNRKPSNLGGTMVQFMELK